MDRSIYIYGVKFPNRIFVGGIPKTATAKELADYFKNYATVAEAKIILNGHGNSKGYGFVTFSSAGDVKNVMKQGQLFFKGKKLNLGPAVRKQSPDVQGEPVLMISTPTASPTDVVTTGPIPNNTVMPHSPPPVCSSPPIYYTQQAIYPLFIPYSSSTQYPAYDGPMY